jgi:hypothetical protein
MKGTRWYGTTEDKKAVLRIRIIIIWFRIQLFTMMRIRYETCPSCNKVN